VSSARAKATRLGTTILHVGIPGSNPLAPTITRNSKLESPAWSRANARGRVSPLADERPLLGGLAVEMFGRGVGVCLRPAHDTITMLGRAVERV
jgi:hypothetical protein